MNKPTIGAGDVHITLGDTDVTLRPSLKAAMALSGRQGGIVDMVNRCVNLEFAAIHDVIVAGMGGKTSKDLQQLIFEAGLGDLAAPCIQYLNVLANGGRAVHADEGEDDEGKREEATGSA